MTNQPAASIAVIAIIVLLPVVGTAQSFSFEQALPDSQQAKNTALLRSELLYASGSSGRHPVQKTAQESPRSVALAFGLSAVIPGAGQVYNNDWVKAGIGFAVETALWTGYAVWKQNGLEGQDRYRAYAHKHFDPARYARWLNEYPGYGGEPIATGPVEQQVDVSAPSTWSSQDRQLIRRLFNQIQAAERKSRFVSPPKAAFSHVLPHFGEQQYYELIGKYYQYSPGWDDCGENCDEKNPSDRFMEYARMHADANRLLRRASRATAVVLLNHGLAALDAVISAQLHNNRLETAVLLQQHRGGEVRPQLTMRLSF